MAEKLAVDRAGLHVSAKKVQGHGDDFSVGHTTTQRRVAAAGGGWTGQSAQALTAWSASLESASTALTDRIGNHSQRMTSAVQKYSENEARRAHEVTDVDPSVVS
jgi:uncharacterized protein YukE